MAGHLWPVWQAHSHVGAVSWIGCRPTRQGMPQGQLPRAFLQALQGLWPSLQPPRSLAVYRCLPQLKGASQGWLPRALPQALQEVRLSVLASVQCAHCQMFASASRSSWLAALLAAAHHHTQFSGQFLG